MNVSDRPFKKIAMHVENDNSKNKCINESSQKRNAKTNIHKSDSLNNNMALKTYASHRKQPSPNVLFVYTIVK